MRNSIGACASLLCMLLCTTSINGEFEIPDDRACPSKIDAALYLPRGRGDRYGKQVLFTEAQPTKNDAEKLDQDVITIERWKKASSPVNRQSVFPDLSKIAGNIDAAVTLQGVRKGSRRMKASYNVLFSGSQYYLYDGMAYRAGPFSIHEDPSESTDVKVKEALHKYNLLNLNLTSEITKIDGAMLFRNGRLYLFSGAHYFRYNYQPEKHENQMDNGYQAMEDGEMKPQKTIRIGWNGMPDNVDSVISHEEIGTYFIKAENLYKLDDRKIHMASGYPEHVGFKWLDCGGEQALLKAGNFGHVGKPTDGDDP